MSKDLQDRLTRTEERLSRLHDSVANLLRSRMDFLDENGLLIAKAQDSSAVQFATGDLKRLNALEAKVHKLEGRLDQACDELGAHVVGETQAKEAYARQTMLKEEQSEQLLAKAVSAGRRRSTPEGLLERADKVLSDPTRVGEVAGYLSTKQFAKAAAIVEAAEQKAAEQDEDTAHERVEGQIKEFELLSQVSELGERVGALQEALTAALGRLSRLETRPTVTPARPQTVAKAAQARQRANTLDDPRNSPEGLMVRLEAVFDSPAQVGTLSSMLQAGRIEEVRIAVEKAELAHEAEQIKRARRRV